MDNPEMFLIGFENKFGGFDRDYNDMVFSLIPIAPLEIVNVLRSHDIPNYDQPVSIVAQISNRTSNLDFVLLNYKIGSASLINTTMSLENGYYIATIPPQPYGSLVSYTVYVSDLIGNFDVSKLYFYTVGDFVSPIISNVHDISPSHVPNELVEISVNVDEPAFASGVKNVTLWYRTGINWVPTNMIINDGIWKALIPGQNENISVSFFIEAFDNAGNKANTIIFDYDVFSPNYSPIPVLMYSPIITYTGVSINFDGSASYDTDGSIVSYFWDFGDGYTSSLSKVTHSFVENGEYSITLTVVDNEGAVSSKVAIQVVKNRSPVAVLIENSTIIDKKKVISFDASGSYDPDGVIVSYLWDFGDGTTGSGSIVNHSYSESGTYTTALTVIDDDGGTDRVFVTKVIADQPPVAILTVSSSTVNVGEVVSFDASGSYDPDGVIVSYLWDFGDQNSTTGITVNHIYSHVGSYVITLTIEDDDGVLSFVISEIIVTEGSILNLALISLVGLGITILTLTLLYGLLVRRRKKE
ncbi:MAG: PKD domain-containing protein [Candidatus Bathyarchaeota archaeon]